MGLFESYSSIKKFKLDNIKKESHLPLAIIIGAIIIATAIYLGTTAEFRHKKAACLNMSDGYKGVDKKFKKMVVQSCISKFDEWKINLI